MEENEKIIESQAGFTDHIFTQSTIVEKFLKRSEVSFMLRL